MSENEREKGWGPIGPVFLIRFTFIIAMWRVRPNKAIIFFIHSANSVMNLGQFLVMMIVYLSHRPGTTTMPFLRTDLELGRLPRVMLPAV